MIIFEYSRKIKCIIRFVVKYKSKKNFTKYLRYKTTVNFFFYAALWGKKLKKFTYMTNCYRNQYNHFKSKKTIDCVSFNLLNKTYTWFLRTLAWLAQPQTFLYCSCCTSLVDDSILKVSRFLYIWGRISRYMTYKRLIYENPGACGLTVPLLWRAQKEARITLHLLSTKLTEL